MLENNLKIGDVIVYETSCSDDWEDSLTIGKYYKVIGRMEHNPGYGELATYKYIDISIIDDKNQQHTFDITSQLGASFISLKELRKLKLQKLSNGT